MPHGRTRLAAAALWASIDATAYNRRSFLCRHRPHPAHANHHGPHAVRQDLGRTRRSHRRGRHRHPLHRPPPGTRSHQPAGVRRPTAGGTQAVARQLHRRHRRPQHPHHRLGAGLRRHCRPDQQRADRHAGRQHPRLWRRGVFPVPQPAPGDRARHRPGKRRHAAGHDRGVRRQPHQHARRVRGAGARHRHQRSRARAGHPNAAGEEGQEYAHPRRG